MVPCAQCRCRIFEIIQPDFKKLVFDQVYDVKIYF